MTIWKTLVYFDYINSNQGCLGKKILPGYNLKIFMILKSVPCWMYLGNTKIRECAMFPHKIIFHHFVTVYQNPLAMRKIKPEMHY